MALHPMQQQKGGGALLEGQASAAGLQPAAQVLAQHALSASAGESTGKDRDPGERQARPILRTELYSQAPICCIRATHFAT